MPETSFKETIMAISFGVRLYAVLTAGADIHNLETKNVMNDVNAMLKLSKGL